MFKTFLEDRMAEKSDYWSDLEMKTRRDLSSYSQSSSSSGSGRHEIIVSITLIITFYNYFIISLWQRLGLVLS